MKPTFKIILALMVVLKIFALVQIANAQNVGIGIAAPLQKLHIAGTNSTERIEGLSTGGSFLIAPGATTDHIVFVNSIGDLKAIPSGANNSVLTTNSSGIPVWSAQTSWQLTGNAGTNPVTNFIGTTDAQNLVFKVFSQQSGKIDYVNSNASFGFQSFLAATGSYNSAFGHQALNNSSGTGHHNTAVGYDALFFNTTGNFNLAIGAEALFHNLDGNQNTALGYNALYSNTGGYYNTAVGHQALSANITGYQNTAVGMTALGGNTTGYNNMAQGYAALASNTSGFNNAAIGYAALNKNVTNSNNTAIGYDALLLSTADGNTAIGSNSLATNVLGTNNTAIGYNVNPTATNLTNYTGIGYLTGSASSTSNRVEIGNTSVSWIGGQVSWSTYSDGRIKDNITENVKGLEFISKLRPVTYTYNLKKENAMMYGTSKRDTDFAGKYDIEKIHFSGFIAQEVEQAAKLASYDFSGVVKPENENQPYSVRYSDFVVPLVKAVQELNEQNLELKKEVLNQKALLLSMQDQLQAKLSAISKQQ